MSELIMLPGPTKVPPAGLKAQSKQVIGHREPKFSELLEEVTVNLKKVFMTENDVLVFPASGTGGLEIAIANTLSHGDKILSINNGVFGKRFRNIARNYNIEVEELSFPFGEPCDYEKIENHLSEKNDYKAVLFTHNETSTGITNNVKKMGEILADKKPLLIVDAVSSLGGIPLKTDQWGVDIVITSSQKALMTPPGLAILSVSPEAWTQIEDSTLPTHYWDLVNAKKYYDNRRQTPYTPAVTLLFALDKALELILNEGLDNVFARHKLFTEALRNGMEIMGIKPYVPWNIASHTVSAFLQPEDINFIELKNHLLNNYKLHFAGGQQKLKNEIFRIGHMGYTRKEDIINTLKAFGDGLRDYNLDINVEKAIKSTNTILK